MSLTPAWSRRSLAPALLAACVQAALLSSFPVVTRAQAPGSAAVARYDIPAQSLTAAIQQYSRASGVQVLFASPDGVGVTSSPVRGDFSPEDALRALLSGTGLTVRFDASGRTAQLERVPEVDASAILTSVLGVEGIQSGRAVSSLEGYSAYGADTLRGVPARNGQITSLLRINPAVQFDNGASSSKTPGDLEPADISIHGAKFWQNLFMVDGLSVNNDINPGDRSYYNVNGSLTDLPGNKSQGIALDTSLIDRVEVHDSNVSAEYGSFNGGVVNAVTRDPKEAFGGSVSVTHTRDAWTRYHIDERAAEAFYGNPAYANGYVRTQPEFETTTWRLNLEGKLTENFGLLGSITRKRSTIRNQRAVNASMAEAGATLREFVDVERQIDSYFLKGVWTPTDRLRVETTITHEPWTSGYFTINARDGDFDMESGGSVAGVTVTWQGDGFVLEQKAHWSRNDQSRVGGPGWYQSWYYSEGDKNWGDPTATGAWASMYGTFGDIYQRQETLQYQGKIAWDAMQAGAVEHRIALGLDLSDGKAWYERKKDFTQGNDWGPTFTCTDANGGVDERHCSIAPVLHLPDGWPEGSGQMANTLNIYRAGRATVKQAAVAFWAEDEMAFGRAELRLGLRGDHDDYMGKTRVAPRLSFGYDLVESGNTRLIAGANRYYGRNIYDYALSAERMLFQYKSVRDPETLLWSDPVRSALSNTKFSQLDVPYDDEGVLGLRQRAWDADIELKYVRRQGRDQIVREYIRGADENPLVNQSAHYEYRNAGRSDTDSVMLTVSPLQPFEWGDTRTTAQFVANWTDVRSSHDNYRTSFDPVEDLAWVQFNGHFIRYYQLPATNYNRPWTMRLDVLTDIPGWNLSLGNYLSARGSYRRVSYTGETVEHEGQPADVYADRRFGTSLNWDMRLMWERSLGSAGSVFANLDITNLLDHTNTVSWSSSEVVYETGRQFQLELGYRF